MFKKFSRTTTASAAALVTLTCVAGTLLPLSAPHAAAAEAPSRVDVEDTIVWTSRVKVTSGNNVNPGGGRILARASGTNGTSSSSGCKTVKITNYGDSALLGTRLFTYWSSVHWCWTRSVRTTYDIQTDWDFSTSAQMYWRGTIRKVVGAYDWGFGAHSGFRHYRKGSFENCVLKVGCLGIWYPTNDLIVHHDGTWHYSLTGADA